MWFKRLKDISGRVTICDQDWQIDIDHIQQWKMQEIWNPFHRQTHLIKKEFSNFERTSSKSYLSSNVHQVCTPKSNNFLRETAVKRILFFRKILMLYEVYINIYAYVKYPLIHIYYIPYIIHINYNNDNNISFRIFWHLARLDCRRSIVMTVLLLSFNRANIQRFFL